MSIFKACDIRGIYPSELDERTAWLLGRAIATRLNDQSVAVAGDLRVSTPQLKERLIEGLLAGGAHVVDLGIIPTPVFYFGKSLLGTQGGVMVTASHNPGQYNGFKIILGDLPVIPEDLSDLAALMRTGAFTSGAGRLEARDVQDAYAASIASAFGGLSRRRVVVDAGSGSFWQLAPRVLEACGQEVLPLYCTPDGSFPNRDPNPAVAANLSATRQMVSDAHADLAVAFDGDGDRAVFIDETGEVLKAEKVLVLLIRSLLCANPGARVVYDIKSSSVVAEEVAAAGGVALPERSGHAFIKRRLFEEGALLGGEVSGHYFIGKLERDDALYTAVLLLQVLDELGMSLGQAAATVASYPITPDLRIPCAPQEAQAIITELRGNLADWPQEHLDGVRILFEDGWALARTSVTEPLITLRFEAHSVAALARIQQLTRQASPRLAAIWQPEPGKLSN